LHGDLLVSRKAKVLHHFDARKIPWYQVKVSTLSLNVNRTPI